MPPRRRIEHFLGDRLLTADNNGNAADAAILDQLNVSVRPLDQRSPSHPEPGRPDVHTGRSPTMLARSMMRTSG